MTDTNIPFETPTTAQSRELAAETVTDTNSNVVAMVRNKIVTGTFGTDGGDVTTANPFPVALQTSSAVIGHTIIDSGTITLPSGAATAANQASELVLLAAIAAGVPVSGSVTANAGTNLNTSALALESGGNLASLVAKDYATQTTLAALNAKVTAVNTGAVVVASGSITANAGTNLNTSTLALESGGNLATIAGKDFATQTTLAALNTKVTTCNTGAVVLTTSSAVIGHVISDSGSTTAVTQATGTNLHCVVDSGTITTVTTLTTCSTVTNVSQFGGVAIALNTGTRAAGVQRVTICTDDTIALSAGSAIVGKVGIDQTTNATTNGVVALPATSGGCLVYSSASLVATGVSVKSSAGQLYGYFLYNTSASTRFVKIYNSGSAPSAGSGTPVMRLPLPAGSGANCWFTQAIAFSSGIGIIATTGVADADSGVPSANDVVVNFYYD